jgi:hypothetical protein
MVKGDPPSNHYKASTICKYTRSVRQSLETKCGLKFGSAGIPALARPHPEISAWRHPAAYTAKYEGIILTPQHGRGPRVSSSREFSDTDKQMKLAYFGACLDGWVLTMRSTEYLSKGDAYNPLAELSRADVRYNADRTAGVMFIRRYKGDKNHKWPVKQLAPRQKVDVYVASQCALRTRNSTPSPMARRLSRYPTDWQQPDGRPITRTRLQNFLQAHAHEADGRARAVVHIALPS